VRRAIAVAALAAAVGAGAARAEPVALSIDPAEADAIAARLAGQRFAIAADRRSVRIDDVAGDGPPVIGVVERRGDASYLVRGDGPALRITGPLARPRIAGPGYTVWISGAVAEGTIAAKRLGVLRRPRGFL
jgi:hypothetical protein